VQDAGGVLSRGTERPLRLCFVSADYPTPTTEREGIGGIGAHAYSLALGIAGLGHDVLVLTETNGPTQRYMDGAVSVHALHCRSRRLLKLGRWVPVPWIRRSFAVWNALQSLHREQPFDLVRFPDGYAEGFRYSITPLTPFELQLHGPASIVQKWDGRRVPKVRARVEGWLERWPATRASLVVAATSRFAEFMTKEWSLDPKRVRIIRNPLDVDQFRPARPGLKRGQPTVLFAGHLQWLKGVTVLAAAIPQVVARHPTVRFEFIGNDTNSAPGGGSMRRLLEDTLSRSGVLAHVSFCDPMPQRELVAHYQNCVALVLPSFHEAYGNVVLEAMACGRPCIVTSAVGAAELIVSGQTGFVVPPDDATALADAICSLLAMSEVVRDEMGIRARRAVESACAASVIAVQRVEAYREVLARQAANRAALPGGGP
jgi:glycosyltransferase involved in cell wall biosynthesis